MSYYEEYLFGNWSSRIAPELFELVKQYYERTEAYDRTVCTGPIRNGGIMPADGFQLGLICRNARRKMKELTTKALQMGFSDEQFNSAFRYYKQTIK
jgi:2-hydroxychromene-2-carboxylate isomerase